MSVRLPALAVAPALLACPLAAQQRQDEEYGKKIKEYLQDARITTELVDHLPASSTVPSPLKFLGRVVGMPGELTYTKDIQRYYAALDQASPRVTMWKIRHRAERRATDMLPTDNSAPTP